MRAIRRFNEFVNENIVKRQWIDKSRSSFLVKEAENGYTNLLEKKEKIALKDVNANDYVKSCYDILMELIRARMLLEGYNASGLGAHEAEVSFLRVLGFDEKDIQFVDQLRFFRNGMLYYGTILDKTYAEKVISFTTRLYQKLQQEIKNKSSGETEAKEMLARKTKTSEKILGKPNTENKKTISEKKP